MNITKFSFFQYLMTTDVKHLFKFVESNFDEPDILKEKDEVTFLYKYFQLTLREDFEPLIVLQYIYMYYPSKNIRIPKLKLNLSISEIKYIVEKYSFIYDIQEIGNHKMFDFINNIRGFTILKTRQEVWQEAIEMSNCLCLYQRWLPSWCNKRAIFHYQRYGEQKMTIAVRRVAEKMVIMEAKGYNNIEVSTNKVIELQDKIDMLYNELSLN